MPTLHIVGCHCPTILGVLLGPSQCPDLRRPYLQVGADLCVPVRHLLSTPAALMEAGTEKISHTQLYLLTGAPCLQNNTTA